MIFSGARMIIIQDLISATRKAHTYEAETAQELFRKFRTGDDAAFTALYQMHNQKLYAYCTKILSDTMAAKDIVHTMWEKIIATRQDSQDIKNPTGYFLRIARN